MPDALHLLDAEHGRYISSSTHRLIRNRNWLIIAPLPPSAEDHIVVDRSRDEVQFAGGTISFKEVGPDAEIPASPTEAHMDARLTTFPLILRKWKKGDYFYPLGMGKKKKISRFLIDLKLSPTQKEKIYVLETGKRICWVVGLRIDDRFKITPATQRVLRVGFSPAAPFAGQTP